MSICRSCWKNEWICCCQLCVYVPNYCHKLSDFSSDEHGTSITLPMSHEDLLCQGWSGGTRDPWPHLTERLWDDVERRRSPASLMLSWLNGQATVHSISCGKTTWLEALCVSEKACAIVGSNYICVFTGRQSCISNLKKKQQKQPFLATTTTK